MEPNLQDESDSTKCGNTTKSDHNFLELTLPFLPGPLRLDLLLCLL